MPKGKYNGGGKPKAIIDWDLVKQLCVIQCTAQEVADVLDIDQETVHRLVFTEQKMKWDEFYKKHKGTGRVSLRRAQWRKGVSEGHPAMLIWLGKQYLDQTDTPQVLLDPNSKFEIRLKLEDDSETIEASTSEETEKDTESKGIL